MSAQAMVEPVPQLELGLGAGLAVLLTGVVGFGLAQFGQRPLSLSLYGELHYIELSRVHETAAPWLERGFFLLDSARMEQELRAIPWVRRADVQRLWPDRVAIRIEHRQALAAWGTDQALSDDGMVLPRPAGYAATLQVDGPPERAAEIAAAVRQAAEQCALAGYRLRRWTVAPNGDTRAVLDLGQGLEVATELGRDELALRLDTLLNTALPVLMPRIGEVGGIDLRYRNGFAVSWQRPGGEEDR